MPTPPFAQLQAAKNGGAPTTGPLDIDPGDSIVFTPVSTVGASQYRYEMYSYPKGYATPSGWTLGTDGVIRYITDATPPAVLAPATRTPGKWAMRLVLNERNPTTNKNLVDESMILRMISANGLKAIAAGEGGHFDALRAYIGELDDTILAIDTLLAAGALVPKIGPITTTNATVTPIYSSASMPASSSLKQIFMVEAINSDDTVKNFWVDDHWVRVGSGAPVRVGTSIAPRDLSGGGTGDADPSFPAVGGLSNAVVGDAIVLSVQGAVAKTIRWNVIAQSFQGT